MCVHMINVLFTRFSKILTPDFIFLMINALVYKCFHMLNILGISNQYYSNQCLLTETGDAGSSPQVAKGFINDVP